MKCLKCNNTEMQLIIEKPVVTYNYSNKIRKGNSNAVISEEGKIYLHSRKCFCTKCGLVMEEIIENDLSVFEEHKQYITDLE